MNTRCLLRTTFWLAALLLPAAPAALHAGDWPAPEAVRLPDTARRAETDADDRVIPVTLLTRELGDVGDLVRSGGMPDTDVAFSPDGRRLAVGTFTGRVAVLDVYAGPRGRLVWEKKVPEGMVKRVAFSADGRTLYYGEQSADGFVYAAEAATGDTRWRLRLADELRTSTPPRDDIYGFYSLPGCYGLRPLAGGDLLVLGVHSWGEHDNPGTLTRLSRIYRLGPDGTVKSRWPARAPAPLTVMHMDADPAGRRVAVLTGHAGGNAPEDSPWQTESLYSLDGRTLEPVGAHTFQPLKPYFDRVWFWQSVSVGPGGRRAAVGMHDGRSFLFDLDTVEPTHTYKFGAPIVISGVPISATATYTLLAPDGMAYFQTGASSVPQGGTEHVVTPPGPHPNANTINAVGPDGRVKWRYRSGHAYQNFWTDARGRWLLTCAERQDEQSVDAGALLFDTRRPGGGTRRLVYYYRVEGRTFFRGAVSPDGAALAIVEVPYPAPESSALVGKYRLHVVR